MAKKSGKKLLSLTLLAMLGLSACGQVGNAGVKGGTQWLTGTEVPTELTGGNVGDFYFDVDDNDIYQLTDEGWVLLTNIKGDKGDTGAQGEKGDKGDTGEAGQDGKDGVNGKDGKDGQDGADGKDGLTPYIGENGNWWIGDEDTGVKAEGVDGEDGKDGINGTDGKDGQDGKDGTNGTDGKDGVDGKTPYIGENGNWWIGDEDTGVKAEGVDGEDGKDGLNGTDGKDGQDGTNGTNGADGKDGQDGKDGVGVENIDIKYDYDENGNEIIVFTITYSDGKTEVIEVLAPKKVTEIIGLRQQIFEVLEADEENNYKLVAQVIYDGQEYGDYELTEDDIISSDVNFYKTGVYKVDVRINGVYNTFEVVVFDLNDANFMGASINRDYKVGSTYDDITVAIYFDYQGYYFEKFLTLRELTTVQDQTFDKEGTYNIQTYYNGFEFEVYVNIYDPEVCTIKELAPFNSWYEVDLGTDVKTFVEENIIGNYMSVIYYEEYNGVYSEIVEITESMLDYSYADFSSLGVQFITISYGLEGQEEKSSSIYVNVIEKEEMILKELFIENYNDKFETTCGANEEEVYNLICENLNPSVVGHYSDESWLLLEFVPENLSFDFSEVNFDAEGSYKVHCYYNYEGFEVAFEVRLIVNYKSISEERVISDAKVANYNGNINITSGTSAEEAYNLIRENLKLEIEAFYNDGSSEYIGYNYENLWFASDVLELKEEGTYFVTGYYKIDNYGEVTFEFTYNVVSESSSEEVTYELGEVFVPNNSIEITTSDKEDTLVKNIAGNYNVELTLYGSDGSKKPVTLTITEDMVVYESVEFGSVGTYWMTIRGTYEGLEFGCQFIVKIIPDLSNAKMTGEYKFTETAQETFGFTSLQVYDNGYGVMFDENATQDYFEISIDENGIFTYRGIVLQINEDGTVNSYTSDKEPVVSYYWDAKEMMGMEYTFYFYDELNESGNYVCLLYGVSGDESHSATGMAYYDAEKNTIEVSGLILQINEDGTLAFIG